MYLSHDKVRTLKPHKCWGCLSEFPAGTEMHRVVSKSGEIITTYWCSPCQDFIDEACKRDRYLADDGFERGYVKEAREEMARQLATKGGA